MPTPFASKTGTLPTGRLDLEVLEEKCQLSFKDKHNQLSILEVQIGIETLVQQVFKHTPPHPIELEHAIELVEEAIMQVQAQVPRRLAVYSQSAQVLVPWAGNLTQPAAGKAQTLGLQMVEVLFNRLASVSQGRPAVQEKLPNDRQFAAHLLIWRELMHHLQIDAVTVLPP